jgi:hypothetical protein
MHVNGRKNVDELLARMEALRGRLDHDAQAAKQSVQEMTDWRNVVRKNPITAVVLVAVVGFLLVPRKRNVPTLNREDLEKLVKDHKIFVAKEAASSPGFVSTVTALAGATLARAASNYIVSKVNEFSRAPEREVP